MQNRSPYEVLGVEPGDTQDKVYAAYKALEEMNSPTLGAGTRHWEAIQTAWKILGDPERRSIYDRTTAMQGKVIGTDYLLLKEIAQSPMGHTYLARDIPTGKLVVVKHCSKRDPKLQDLLRNQARTIFDLDHHMIPTVRRLLELPDGTLALVMGYKPGKTLEVLVKEYGRLHPECVTWIAARILNVLWFLHHRGVVHGGLEPRNILVENSRYEVCVVDFSLSRISGAQLKTNPGYIESFASPEQELGLVLLPESDLYSLGALIVYLLNGGNIDQVKKRLIPSETEEPLKTFLQSLLQ